MLKGRNFISGLLVATVICAVAFVNIIAYTLGNYFGWYFYVSEEPDFSISDTFSDTFMAAEGKQIKVTFCMSRTELESNTFGAYVLKTAEEFVKKYPDLFKLRFVNLVTKYDADGNDVKDELEIYKDNGRGGRNYISEASVIFECGQNYRVLTDVVSSSGFADFYTLDSNMYVTSYNGEEIFAAMSAWVLSDKHPEAYFTIGHGEAIMPTLYNLLLAAGYYVDTVNLRDRADADEKLARADLLVIANPTTDIDRSENPELATEYERIKNFADKGGSLFVTVDPYAKRLDTFYSLLSEYGIALYTTEDGSRQTVKDDTAAITLDGFTFAATVDSSDSVSAGIKNKLDELGGSVILSEASPLLLTGEAKPLLVSSPSAVCYSGGEVSDTRGSYAMAAYSTLEGQLGEESKLFFIPSIYLTAIDAMVTRGYANKDFLYSLFDEFFEMGDMPYGCNSILYDTTTLENLTMGTARVYTALILSIPAVICIVGAVTLIRRRNR